MSGKGRSTRRITSQRTAAIIGASVITALAATMICTRATIAAAAMAGTARISRSIDDSASVAGAVRSFHDALSAGDSVRALSLLDSSVVILESGDEERFAHYKAHHLAADIEFTRAVRTATTPVRVVVRGDVAWATSTSVTTGTFRGRPVNSSGAELMVLTRVGDAWRIAAIHWSSHARRSR